MKILFTGASSFTGMWFARALAEASHQVTTTFLRPIEGYTDLRLERVAQVVDHCTPVFNCFFGSEMFLNLLKNEHWDILCHHAADVVNYKSPDFDFAAALAANTRNIKQTILLLKDKGCGKILLTGSVFEQNEGQGSDNLRAVSPYGLSKGLTTDVFKYFCDQYGVKLGKFVIPNPFGPYEEPRFTTFLVRSWFDNAVPKVSSPDYVRDNIPVSLLAKVYLKFLEGLKETPTFEKCSPTGFQESQGDFTKRFSAEMEKRLSIKCPFQLGVQNDFPEPKVRLNTGWNGQQNVNWDETEAWDELADYYNYQYGAHEEHHSGCSCHHP